MQVNFYKKKQKSKLHILHLGFCSISLKIAKTNCYKMIEIKKHNKKKFDLLSIKPQRLIIPFHIFFFW
jgi:hypothetical protein